MTKNPNANVIDLVKELEAVLAVQPKRRTEDQPHPYRRREDGSKDRQLHPRQIAAQEALDAHWDRVYGPDGYPDVPESHGSWIEGTTMGVNEVFIQSINRSIFYSWERRPVVLPEGAEGNAGFTVFRTSYSCDNGVSGMFPTFVQAYEAVYGPVPVADLRRTA